MVRGLCSNGPCVMFIGYGSFVCVMLLRGGRWWLASGWKGKGRSEGREGKGDFGIGEGGGKGCGECGI